MQFDIFALAGATLAMMVPFIWGMVKDKKFNPYFLIDSLGGAVAGAMLVPGLADITPADPPLQRFIAGLMLALGAKFMLRSWVSKPIQTTNETKEIVEAAKDLANRTPDLSRKEAVELATEIKAAETPAEVTTIIERMVRTEDK